MSCIIWLLITMKLSNSKLFHNMMAAQNTLLAVRKSIQRQLYSGQVECLVRHV